MELTHIIGGTWRCMGGGGGDDDIFPVLGLYRLFLMGFLTN